jgi:hypothetical protein
VALEDLLRRFIRDALHVEQRAMGVPDAPLSEAGDPGCVRSGPTIAARAPRGREFKTTVAIRGHSERRAPKVAPYAADSTRLL